MSLLLLHSTDKFVNIAQRVFNQQFQLDDRLGTEYNQTRKMHMLEDILYNLECLNISIKYNADTLFMDNALWIYNLLVSRMTDIAPERIKEQLIDHFNIMISVLEEELDETMYTKAVYHLKNAIKATENAVASPSFSDFNDGEYAGLRQQYLNYLLAGDRKSAGHLITTAIDSGVKLEDIYIEVFQRSMWQVGALWHDNKITVDKEHYCTAVTQGIMAQLYSYIFSTPRKDRSILACCVGKELHEMGIRMLCDLFELNGWDSIYLGAAVPIEGILNSVQERRPNLLALSVTMPHNLTACEKIVKSVRQKVDFDLKIAVGGRPFSLAPNIAKDWEVDIAAVSGLELIQWANTSF